MSSVRSISPPGATQRQRALSATCTAQVFDYDYAPASELVEGHRMFINVSQEGKSDLDYLREEELVNGLKISSKSHMPVTMYQISKRGADVLRSVDQYDRDAVHHVALSPSRSLMQVEFDGTDFWLVASSPDGKRIEADGFRKRSSVLEIEEVSYVSSAYIPGCLRHGGRPTLSNAHRVEECTRLNAGTIRDDLDEVITLNSVSVIVGEYLPFGSNQMVQLNQTMGSPERVLGGFLTAAVRDDQASLSNFHIPAGLTAVQILDYSLAGHVNLEADIRIPEPEGIVQIETFGVSLNANGGCFFGLQLEAVMDRVKDAISLDHLSRLLVDVQTDSSEIVKPLLSLAQRRILNLVYRKDAANRNKVNLIIANEITPHLTAEEYMDKGEYENELKQVLGDTRAAFDVTDQDTLIFGANGLLLAGPNSRVYEPLLCSYVQLLSMDLFVQNLFSVTAVVRDEIRATSVFAHQARRNPIALRLAMDRVAPVARHVLLLEKTVAYMEESLLATEVPEPPLTAAGRALYERLSIPQMQAEMARRVTDLSKYLKEIRQELQVLEKEATHVEAECDRDVQQGLHETLLVLRDHLREPRWVRTMYSLESIQWAVMALLGFALLDRLSGDWSVVDSEWFRAGANALITNSAMVWLLFSLLSAGGLIYLAYWWYYRQSKRNDEDVVRISLEVRRAMSLASFMHMLSPKRILRSDWEVTTTGDRVTITWLEEANVDLDWGNVKPVISVTYSPQLNLMLRIGVEYQRGTARDLAAKLSEQDLRDRIMRLLERNNVLLPDPHAPELIMGPSPPARIRKAADGEDEDEDEDAVPDVGDLFTAQGAGAGASKDADGIRASPSRKGTKADETTAAAPATGGAATAAAAAAAAGSATPSGRM